MKKIMLATAILALATTGAFAQDSSKGSTGGQGGPGTMPVTTQQGTQSVAPTTGQPVGAPNPATAGTDGANPDNNKKAPTK
jgi:hypothetical protein